jgi:hypothetical protein
MEGFLLNREDKILTQLTEVIMCAFMLGFATATVITGLISPISFYYFLILVGLVYFWFYFTTSHVRNFLELLKIKL